MPFHKPFTSPSPRFSTDRLKPVAESTIPAHVSLATVFQVRAGRLQVLLWKRAQGAVLGRVGAARRRPRRGRDARGVDPPPTRRQGGRAGALAPRAARDVERPRSGAPSGARSRPPTSGSSPPTSTRRCRTTRPGTRSTRCRRWRSTTGRSRSPGVSGSGRSCRTRTSASRSRPETFTISQLRELYAAALGHPVSTTNLQRVLLRRGLLEPTGERREPGPTGGRPAAVFRFRSRRLEITDQSAVLRPPELRAS